MYINIFEPNDTPSDWTDDHIAFEAFGLTFFIDKHNLHLIRDNKLYLSKGRYLYARMHHHFMIPLHRYINKTPKGLVCDHINRNRRDLRELNLRAVSAAINNHNVTTKYKYKGIRFKKRKWEASFNFNYQNYYLGRFNSAEEAAKAHDLKAVEILGKYAKTNFPLENYHVPEVNLVMKKRIYKKMTKYESCAECGKTIARFENKCKTCATRIARREEKIKRGLSPRIYKPRVKEKLLTCIKCTNKAVIRNLCSKHYYEDMGKKKPKKKYFCEIDGCDKWAWKNKERLCKNHWNQKQKELGKNT